LVLDSESQIANKTANAKKIINGYLNCQCLMIRSLLMLRIKTTTVDMNADTDKKTVVVKTTLAYQTPLCEVFFFFSFAYTTSPAAMMKLVVFFRSSKPPYKFW